MLDEEVVGIGGVVIQHIDTILGHGVAEIMAGDPLRYVTEYADGVQEIVLVGRGGILISHRHIRYG